MLSLSSQGLNRAVGWEPIEEWGQDSPTFEVAFAKMKYGNNMYQLT